MSSYWQESSNITLILSWNDYIYNAIDRSKDWNEKPTTFSETKPPVPKSASQKHRQEEKTEPEFSDKIKSSKNTLNPSKQVDVTQSNQMKREKSSIKRPPSSKQRPTSSRPASQAKTSQSRPGSRARSRASSRMNG